MRGRSKPEPPPTAAAPWAERPPSALELEQRFQRLTGMSSRFDTPSVPELQQRFQLLTGTSSRVYAPNVLELEQRFQLLTGMSPRFYKMMKEREQEGRRKQGKSLEQELLERLKAKARQRRLRCWSQSWNQELLERLKAKARAERETCKGKTSKGKGNIDEGTIGDGDDYAGKGEIGGKAVRPAKAKAQKEQRWPVPRGSVAVHSLKSGCRKIGKERLAAEDPKKAL